MYVCINDIPNYNIIVLNENNVVRIFYKYLLQTSISRKEKAFSFS